MMSDTASAGLFIYAKDLERLAAFYQGLLGLSRVHATHDLVVLRSPDLEVLVHAIPAQVAVHVDISCPPAKRESAAYKFFFTVPSLQQAHDAAPALGGEVLAERWSGAGFNVCNAVDPEGNIFQLRQNAP